MNIHPQVIQQNGIVTVTMIAQFTGDPTDATDQQRIQAYGDPPINLGGLFTDPAMTTFQFTFPAAELYAGLTTAMQNHPARFMSSLPARPPQRPNYIMYQPENLYCEPGPLDCITSDPVHAATVWAATIETRAAAAMAVLRAKTPAQLTSLPDQDV